MKTTVKILILCIACILAISGIMIYAKTRVAPPESLNQIDQYALDLNTGISQIKDFETLVQTDSAYDALINRIYIFNSENKINAADNGNDIKKLLAVYSSIFLNSCFSKFNASAWYDSDHSWMKDRIEILINVKLSDNTSAVNKSTLDSLNLVSGIISKYHSAISISKASSYRGVDNARAVINSAHTYAIDTYLSHNASLVSALNAVEGRIHDSHFNYILGQVNELSEYRSMNGSYFMNALVPQVESAFKEYENNAPGLYGYKRSTDDLWSRARSICLDAVDYYDNINQ